MKVVHINTYQTGGAAICAIRIHNALKKRGVESKMIFAYGIKTADFDVIDSEPYQWSKHWILRKIQCFACKLHMWPLYEYLEYKHAKIKKRGGRSFFTFPVSQYKKLVEHPWIIEADIVHLHWIAGFVDYPSFFRSINKPIVWTLHDENPGLGGFHYTTAREKAPIGLYDSLERVCTTIKRKVYLNNRNLHLIAISKLMKDFVKNNNLLRKFPVTEIYNGIDEDEFKIEDKNQSRRDLSLPLEDQKILLFSSYNIWDERKGLRELIQAIEKIHFDKKPVLVCLGNCGELPQSDFIDFVCPGLIQDKNILSKYYSAADLFVMPSFQESFGQTPVESVSCGTPVIAFPSGIIPELINVTNGFVCRDYTVEALIEGLSSVLSRSYDSTNIRKDAIKKFSYCKISQQYLELYSTVV